MHAARQVLNNRRQVLALAIGFGLLAVLTWEFTSVSKWASRALVLVAIALNVRAELVRRRQLAEDDAT